MKDKLTLTVKETAELLGISRNSAYLAIATGQLPYIKLGKRILIPRLALQELLNGAGRAEGANNGSS